MEYKLYLWNDETGWQLASESDSLRCNVPLILPTDYHLVDWSDGNNLTPVTIQGDIKMPNFDSSWMDYY